jgi:hypothetical protein
MKLMSGMGLLGRIERSKSDGDGQRLGTECYCAAFRVWVLGFMDNILIQIVRLVKRKVESSKKL